MSKQEAYYVAFDEDQLDPKQLELLEHLITAIEYDMLAVCNSTDTRTGEQVLMLCAQVEAENPDDVALIPLALVPKDWNARFTPPKHSRQKGVQ